jgi:hypothetical protein
MIIIYQENIIRKESKKSNILPKKEQRKSNKSWQLFGWKELELIQLSFHS